MRLFSLGDYLYIPEDRAREEEIAIAIE